MGKALYRTYRSKSFDEVVGQDHITTTLKNSLKNGTIGHAYLLTGPRGVGKTTIARLLACAVNNIAYDENQSQLDIIEIDAASNRRIEEIRSLRDKVHIAPTSLKYKVYIIDEVHMLTKEAFNALLKTLEEPPSHVLFILATTEIHKLPDTIISRCIRFTFKPIQTEQITSHLASIAKKEKINIDGDAIELISEHAGGSFRDAISLLDQVKNSQEKIDKASVELMLGLAPEKQIDQILDAVNSGDTSKLYKTIEEARDFGSSESRIASQLSESIRSRLINYDGNNPVVLLVLLEELLSVPQASSPSSRLEIVLLRATLAKQSAGDNKGPEPDGQVPSSTKKQQPTQPTPDIFIEVDHNQSTVVEDQKSSQEVLPETKVGVTKEDLLPQSDLWASVLDSLKSKHNTLYGVARMAAAQHEGNELILSFKFPFHYKKIDDAKSKALISEVMKELGHDGILLRVELDQASQTSSIDNGPVQTTKAAPKDELSTITNIFGASEMLES